MHLYEFSYNNTYQASIGMAPFEALYGRPCRTPSCWAEVADTVATGPEVIQDHIEKVRQIRQRLQAVQDWQRKYTDPHRRVVEFRTGKFNYLRVSPRKGHRRFGFKGKLAPRYTGPFEIMERIGKVAYRLALPPQLAGIHDVFHISMLRRCEGITRQLID